MKVDLKFFYQINKFISMLLFGFHNILSNYILCTSAGICMLNIIISNVKTKMSYLFDHHYVPSTNYNHAEK